MKLPALIQTYLPSPHTTAERATAWVIKVHHALFIFLVVVHTGYLLTIGRSGTALMKISVAGIVAGWLASWFWNARYREIIAAYRLISTVPSGRYTRDED